MPAVTATARASLRRGSRIPLRSKRLLALAGDERLVEQIRQGNELAFEVAFERHGAGVLAFCRHMLGSREEAEDAVQHTFAAAHRDLQRHAERPIALKAWLYTIARNRCLSLLRARREPVAELAELPTEGLDDQVERRSELRQLLEDLHELPEEQRAALLLAEAGGLSHPEVAGVLGCEVARVKALVFRARSGLIERRSAREMPCAEIREQLANLRGGALRRNELRHHLRHCPGCSEYREQVRHQRQMLAAALPVAPTLGLKSSVLAAVGLGGGAATGGGALLGGSLGSAAIAKVAVAGLLAGGGLVAGDAVVDRATGRDSGGPGPALAPSSSASPATPAGGREADVSRPAATGDGRPAEPNARGRRMSAERSHGRRGAERRAARSGGRGNAGDKAKSTPPGHSRESGGRRLGHDKRTQSPAAERPSGQGRPEPKPSAEPLPKATEPKLQSAPASPKPAPVEEPSPASSAPHTKVKLPK